MIITSQARLKKLQKYLQIEPNITWEQYLQRFEGSKPIELWTTNYPFRLQPEEIECEVDLIGKLSSKYSLKRFERQYKLVAGFKKKVRKEEVEGLPCLSPNFLGLRYLIRKDVIDLMLALCPDDFEAIPVKVVSARKDVEPFELNDYYDLNVLKCIKAIDESKTDMEWSSNGIAHIKKFCYKENPWQDGCKAILSAETLEEKYQSYRLEKPCKIAIDALSGAIVFHPEVAKLFPFDSLYWFIRDVEQNSMYPS